MPETFTTKQLAAVSGVSMTQTTCYTVPASTKAVLASICLCNTSNSATVAVSLNVGVVYVMLQRPLAPLETLVLQINVALAAGTVVQLQADTASVVHALISGVEITP